LRLLFLCFFFIFSFSIFADECTEHHCIAIVDAGSTGSRLHLWQYELDKDHNPIILKELFTKKISPGITSLAPNDQDTDKYLSQLFSISYQNSLPVYFYATAGMRLAPPNTQKKIYSDIKLWFDSQTNWLLKDLKTLSGKEEAVYGWVAMNYKTLRLQSPEKPLFSVLDMGGASVQVTFPVAASMISRSKDIEVLDLFGRHIVLFAHSFLGLGETETLHQMQEARACFPQAFVLPDNSTATGNSDACVKKISHLVNDFHHVNHIIKPILKRNPQQEWFIMGSSSYLVSTPPLMFDQSFTNEGLIVQAQEKLCHPDWASLLQLYPEDEFLYAHCFDAAYNYALMVNGYGIPASTPITYREKNEGADWTLGALLLLSPANIGR
jgi:hypothetical protein